MYKQFFKALQSFTPVPDEELQKAKDIFHPVRLEKECFFVRAGEIPQTLGFVVSGLLRFYYIDAAGNEFIKSFSIENGFVAAYSGLLLGEPSRLFIDAIEDSLLLVAHYEAYQTLSAGHPCWQIINRKVAEGLYIKKEKRESQLLLDDATTRYLRFLKEYPGLEGRLKQYHIASYLGITPVSLSRIRAAQSQKINIG